ncbi:MAG: hypothetical protein A3G18_02330 [Rhodospirillales bacterium RIFCSPLOWO2_12_FULL_58_28]|nr:MAG: hypothetical protein A3H92_06970 [Rhodospirillales bacterium RIFCSPLOWO2_02_FULL_58_16]OHC78890.1 MAG: hypothetical protein A3G18_02330 [Rhodospirillales bacterium RIFCSPLOWO2_12_FULL_58_28]
MPLYIIKYCVPIIILTLSQAPAFAADPHPLPENYWQKPLALQGEAPEHSLAPEACGECHAGQYEEWRSSLHAKAFSPGLVGQLMASFAGGLSDCMQCHAPLAEQEQAFRDALKAGRGHIPAAQGLAAAGNSCSGCHLRGRKHYGPPKAVTGETGQSDSADSHGGVFRSAGFEDSSFCASCHQFPPSWGAVNGKPLENTHNEWKDSPQGKKGVTCQSCHMPGRRHLWLGIHDPEMTASGLTPAFSAKSDKASFALTNTGVGHAFPTYVTPKAVMRAVRLDDGGEPIRESEVFRVIRRSVSFADGVWVEAFDTRLPPGRSESLDITWGAARRVRMWLEIYPDDFYDHQVYDGLKSSLKGEAAKLIAKADDDAGKSRYRLFETDLDRPR